MAPELIDCLYLRKDDLGYENGRQKLRAIGNYRYGQRSDLNQLHPAQTD
jgi:hypothetical protein